MPSFASMASEPAIQKISSFDGARDFGTPAARLEEVRKRARKFREEMLSGGQALFYKSCELVRVPYPTRYAFTNVYTQRFVSSPIIHIVNRLFVIQFKSNDGIKTLLFSPSDIMANAETRFFKRFAGGKIKEMSGEVGNTSTPQGLLKTVAQKVIAPIRHTVQEWLAELGIAPEDVDYISYDHLHTQDVRNWIGSEGNPGYFPNAKLLIMKEEWESAQGLVPPQMDWYCPNGTKGIDTSRVVLLDGDVKLGEGVAFIRTPGHTMGNHSLVAHTPDGILVSSENGVSPDCYAPEKSSINAVRRYAKATNMEVVLNGNTQESGLDQYISMVQEKEMAGPSRKNPDFPNTVCSSEFTQYWLFRGLKPTMTFGDLEYGRLQKVNG